MTGNLDCLSNKRKHYKKIYFANGEHVISKYIGIYYGYINDNKITLKNVLYVPEFKKNLISIDCLSNQHFKTVFQKYDNKNWCHIYNKNNNKVCCTSANNSNTYVIWTSKNKINFENNLAVSYLNTVNKEDFNSFQIWYRRFGHYNINNIKDILPKISNICAKTKLKNFPFHPNDKKTNEPLELIHMDTVTISDYSLYNNKYFLSILDDYSRFGWIIFLKSKSEVFPTFSTWYNKIKNIFNKNIIYVQITVQNL